MCGICGVFEYEGAEPVEPEVVRRMTTTMTHRGPDGDGFLFRSHLGLGMRRLAVIDVNGGWQPLRNEDNTVHVILNGEIYNHRALQRDLEARGHRFRTRSDTETLVHLYEEYGESFIDRLDGMFAFALWDERVESGRGRLIVGRDRVGKKPLYFVDTGRALVFASELKAIFAEGRVNRTADPQAIHDYLSLGMIPAPRSVYRDIKKLLPGHVLDVAAGGVVSSRSYWQWPEALPTAVSPADAQTRVTKLLTEAVEKRLESDVPLGAFLSGGIDSSLVCAIASRMMTRPLDTFSIGFEGPETHNELPFARIAAQHIGTRHHEFRMKPNIVELLPELLQATDEPFAISSAVPLLLLSRAARQHVTVVLTGDGGDEVLGGYEHYLYERWAAIARTLPGPVTALARGVADMLPHNVNGALGRTGKRARQFLGNAHGHVAERRLGWTGWFTEAEKWSLYGHEWQQHARARGVVATSANLLELSGRGRKGSAEHLDAVVWLPDEMLAKVDRMTMRASLEARSPFLDIALIHYCASLSMRQKIPGNRQEHLKGILKQVAATYLPASLLARRKHGFNVPLDAWFRGDAGRILADTLRTGGSNDVFDVDAVMEMLNAHRAGVANYGNRLFALATFQLWAERELSGRAC